MPITEDQYKKIAEHIKDSCTAQEIKLILNEDFRPLRVLILDELLMTDYQGAILDIVFEDLFTQKKKPYLKIHLGELADFLMSDLSLRYIRYHLEKLMK